MKSRKVKNIKLWIEKNKVKTIAITVSSILVLGGLSYWFFSPNQRAAKSWRADQN